MKFNTDPAFVGVEKLKTRQYEQLQLFEGWAAGGEWRKFHHSHYDWWMFPVDAPSRFGLMWTVYEGDIAELKKDAVYLQRYLRGVVLLGESWGWDVLKREYIANPQPDQTWQDWPIRLYKATQSLRLFGFEDYFQSMKQYGKDLLEHGAEMEFNGKDLSGLFR